MIDKTVRALITCINGTMAPAAVALLRAQSRFPIRIFGADVSEPGPGAALLDGFFTVPPGDSSDYPPAITALAAREGIDVVVPWSDPEAFALAAARGDLRAAGAEALVSPPEVLDLIRDKFETYRQLSAAGIEVPEYACVATEADLRHALRAYRYPARTVVLKPASGRGGRGLHVLCGQDGPPEWLGSGSRERRLANEPNAEQLGELLRTPLLVMPALGLPAYDVDILARRGQARAAVVRRRTNPTGIPFEGNLVMADPVARRYCCDIAEALGLDSLHDVDLMTEPGGAVRLLEVNPRPSGSLAASLAAGAPLLDAAISQALGHDLAAPVPERDVTILRIPMALAAYDAQGEGVNCSAS